VHLFLCCSVRLVIEYMFSVLRDLVGIVDIYIFNLGLVLEYLSSMEKLGF